MSMTYASPFLRRSLLLDALATGATAALLLLGAGMLTELLNLPAPLLRLAGAILIPFVAFVAWTAMRPRIGGAAVWTIVVCNALWVLASIILLLGDWVAPSVLGYAFVIAQAVAVGVFAELQVMGLRRRTTVPA